MGYSRISRTGFPALYKLLRSELKVKILLSLLKGVRKPAGIKAEVGSSETTILHALRDLETQNLVFKHGKFYKLTPLGVIEALIVEEVSSTIEVLDKFSDFWLFHDVKNLPPDLLKSIGSLKDSILIQTKPTELSSVHEAFLNILLTSKKIKGVSPIFHQDYVAIIKQILSQGASVDLIFTTPVLRKTLDLADPELMTKYVEAERLKIFIRDDSKFALTVTENCFSLGLFTLAGDYDYTTDLISYSKEALEWGEKLFENCLSGAKRFGLNTSC